MVSRNPNLEQPPIGKKCSRCKKFKFWSKFQNVKAHKDGKSCACKECINKYYREKRKAEKVKKTKKKKSAEILSLETPQEPRLKKSRTKTRKTKKNTRPRAKTRTKKCRLCGKVKYFTEFHKRTKSPDGKDDRCKPCSKIRRRIKCYKTTLGTRKMWRGKIVGDCMVCPNKIDIGSGGAFTNYRCQILRFGRPRKPSELPPYGHILNDCPLKNYEKEAGFGI